MSTKYTMSLRVCSYCSHSTAGIWVIGGGLMGKKVKVVAKCAACGKSLGAKREKE